MMLIAVGLLVLLLPRRIVERVRAFIPGQVVRVVVVEGADLFQVAGLVGEKEVCTFEAFVEAATDAPWLAELGVPAPSAEGYLAPASYDFFRDTPARQVVEKMVSRRRRDLQGLTELALPAPLVSAHEALTLASLVEREAHLASERPLIARAFLNRLLDGQGETRGRLQSDPSAVYGCLVVEPPPEGCAQTTRTNPARRVTPAMLRARDNPYNTYRRSGLPPGPISNPGVLALGAVLHPAEGNQLYFVADGHGGHVFSSSYEEHRRLVERTSNGTAPH
jgi:UPF0755 protein